MGDWKNNKMDGKGIFTWSGNIFLLKLNNNVQTKIDGRKYDGEYADDKK